MAEEYPTEEISDYLNLVRNGGRKSLIPAELGWEVEGEIVYEKAADEEARER